LHIIDSHFHWWPRSIFDKLCKRQDFPKTRVNKRGGYDYMRRSASGQHLNSWAEWFDLDKQFEYMESLGHQVDVVTRDEVGQLAASFNAMVARLQVRARSLEEEERKHTDELLQLQSRMVHSEKLASMGRLAAGVAHELNTPLGGVLSLAMLVLEECDESHPFRKDLEIIVKQTLRCRDIVKGLLDFAHQSEGRGLVCGV
jgi:signal transduction histidine kinase